MLSVHVPLLKIIMCINMYLGIHRIRWRMTDSLMDPKTVDVIHYKMGGLRNNRKERMLKVINDGMFLK